MGTTNQMSPATSTSQAVRRTSYPVSFSLQHDDLQHVLYIVDDIEGQNLNLEITNTSGRDIVLTKNGTKVDEDHHHFELRFRPRTLSVIEGITLADTGWRLGPGPSSLYFLSTENRSIKAGETLKLILKHVSADGSGGARGTRVELRHKNLQYGGQPPKPVAPSPRIEHLSIINRRGQKHIPLHVGFVGSDTILNDDGKSANDLTLRITNAMPDQSISLSSSSRFIISFDANAVGESKEWALAEASSVDKITISAELWKRTGGAGTPWTWSLAKNLGHPDPIGTQSQSPSWRLPGGNIPWEDKTALNPGEYIQLKIETIVSQAPSGHANLYVRYENIPGYWDGQFVCVIEKGPIVYRDDKVGIGTNHPKSNLAVAGGAAVGSGYVGAGAADGALLVQKNVGIGTTSPGAALQVGDQPGNDGGVGFGKDVAAMFTCAKANFGVEPETVMVLAREGKSGSSYANFARFDLGMFEGDGSKSQLNVRLSHAHLDSEGTSTPVIMSLRSNGNVGIGTSNPRSTLSVFGSAAIGSNYAKTPVAADNSLVVEGEVGVGVDTPQAKLHVVGKMKVEGDGQFSGNVSVGTINQPAVLSVRGGTMMELPVDVTANHVTPPYSLRGTIAVGDTVMIGGESTRVNKVFDSHLEADIDQLVMPWKTTIRFRRNLFQVDDDDGKPQLMVTPHGRIGIGTAPDSDAKLHVDGSVRATGVDVGVGTIRAKGIDVSAADVAENYFSNMDLVPGDVVCLDRSHDRIVLSEKPDDLLAVGVISTESGVLLNAKSNGGKPKNGMLAYPVALHGRVPCKVVDENGPINRGDLLTTSSTTGHAMKALPVKLVGIEIYRPGSIIGKALEAHSSGKGMIEVLITGS